MSSKTVLVVSTSDDAHVNHIVPLIQNRGAEVKRLDGDRFPDIPCYFNLCSETTSAPLKESEADVVWYRRVVLPERFDVTAQFISQETEGLLNALLANYEGVRWVNNRHAMNSAKPKLQQLSTAQRFGFRVPRSILTNQESILKRFYHENDGQIVAKPIQTQVIVSPDGELVVGTRKLRESDIKSAVQFFPCFAQQRLKLDHEMRVIVFGDQLFAFRLKATAPADDLKQLKLNQIQHQVSRLDVSTESKIRRFMLHYNLEFGAFDFGVTDDDEPYFLELNPNGQWLWLQFMTGCNLEVPFVNLLLK